MRSCTEGPILFPWYHDRHVNFTLEFKSLFDIPVMVVARLARLGRPAPRSLFLC